MFKRRVELHPLRRLKELVWPSAGWSRTLKYGWHRVWRLNGTPHAIALGLAAGAFASFTPFVGFHFALAFTIAWAIRGNLIASAFGTFIGNPFTFPFIWIATFDLGVWMLGDPADAKVKPEDLSSDLLTSGALESIMPILRPMIVGSLPLGLIAAFVFYFFARGGIEVYQIRRRERLAARAKFHLSLRGKSRESGEAAE